MPNLRRAVRAIILDEHDRILLCRFDFPHPAVPEKAMAVWAAPGGGIEPGEDRLTALRRELREETAWRSPPTRRTSGTRKSWPPTSHRASTAWSTTTSSSARTTSGPAAS